MTYDDLNENEKLAYHLGAMDAENDMAGQAESIEMVNEPMANWISLKEKKPMNDEFIILYSPSGDGTYFIQRWFPITQDLGYFTHWLPLYPKPTIIKPL